MFDIVVDVVLVYDRVVSVMYGCYVWLNFLDGLGNGQDDEMKKIDEVESFRSYWLEICNIFEIGNSVVVDKKDGEDYLYEDCIEFG